ncbi:unnamed protein product [Echinostoma caproni]|uniref:Uncharacterized protein n=1 Tax=Echinostoma caproni TaxID=27848 RepID=A0A3P8HHQ8_9TREM|nr:unnamed protein product [Echinostoma caproni]
MRHAGPFIGQMPKHFFPPIPLQDPSKAKLAAEWRREREIQIKELQKKQESMSVVSVVSKIGTPDPVMQPPEDKYDLIEDFTHYLSIGDRLLEEEITCLEFEDEQVGPAPILTLTGELIEEKDNFFAVSYILLSGRITDGVSARVQNARLALANLRHLWRRRDSLLSVKGRGYAAAVQPVLLYGAETSVFEQQSLRRIARIW